MEVPCLIDASGFAFFQSRFTLPKNTAIRLDVSLEIYPVGLIMGGPVFFDGLVDHSSIPRELLTPIKAIKVIPERTPR